MGEGTPPPFGAVLFCVVQDEEAKPVVSPLGPALLLKNSSCHCVSAVLMLKVRFVPGIVLGMEDRTIKNNKMFSLTFLLSPWSSPSNVGL